MATTLAQKDALTTSDPFLGRVRQACREIAAYFREQAAPGTPHHDWSIACLLGRKARQMAADMAGELVTDVVFAGSSEADASDISDSSLKAAVELYCFNYSG